MIQISYRDARLIYEQVRDSYQQQILAGVLSPGDKLPSVRELSSALAINPNTIQRAYRELEQGGYICSVRRKGSFVANTAHAADVRRKELLQRLDEVTGELMALGCTEEELRERIGGGADRASGD